MKEYTVIALSVGARGNKIFKSGQTVTEENFSKGRAEELVKAGFLKPKELFGTPLPKTSLTPAIGGGKVNGNDLDDEDNTDDLKIDDITKKQLAENLTIAGIPFDPNAKKEDLFNLYISSLNKV